MSDDDRVMCLGCGERYYVGIAKDVGSPEPESYCSKHCACGPVDYRALADTLQAERDEAMEILSPGRLYRGDSGEEIPTTLVERAKWTVSCLESEADATTELGKKLNDLRALADTLTRALEAHGEHDPACSTVDQRERDPGWLDGDEFICDCWLGKALAHAHAAGLGEPK